MKFGPRSYGIFDSINPNNIVTSKGKLKLVDEIIYKTFHAISAKRKKQSETVGLINYFFFSGGQAETEFTYDYYKVIRIY